MLTRRRFLEMGAALTATAVVRRAPFAHAQPLEPRFPSPSCAMPGR